MNRMGPSTEPWGTPEERGDGWDVKVFNWMNCVRPERYDLNQSRGVSEIPIDANLSRRVVWEMVSKAALRSRRMRMDNSPESAAIRR